VPPYLLDDTFSQLLSLRIRNEKTIIDTGSWCALCCLLTHLLLSYFILNTAGFSIISTGTGVGFTPSVARAVSSTGLGLHQ
jgi:hypothetical protein